MPSQSINKEIPSESGHQSKIIIVLLILILSLALIATSYLFSQNQTLSQQLKTSKPTPSPAVVKGPSFQDILENYCQDITLSPTVSLYGIKLENLPVSIDQSVVPITFQSQDTVTCMSGGENLAKSNFVSIEYGPYKQIFLYDQNSKEPGHGGQSFFGSRPVVLKDDGQIKWSMSLNWPEAGCTELENRTIVVRGERRLKLLNGETVLASTETEVTDPGDPRLVETLAQNLKDSECSPGQKDVVFEGTDEKVKKRFFSNFDRLESPEKERVAEIQKILMAITPKAINTSAPQTTLTEAVALSVAEQQIGACDCTNRSAAINSNGNGVWTVTITDTGLADDSLSGQKTLGTITSQNGTWVWKTTSKLYSCAPNRGHQNFSATLCL